MEENLKKDEAKRKPKNLKAATHILKKVALKRYREKLLRQSLDDNKAASLDLGGNTSTPIHGKCATGDGIPFKRHNKSKNLLEDENLSKLQSCSIGSSKGDSSVITIDDKNLTNMDGLEESSVKPENEEVPVASTNDQNEEEKIEQSKETPAENEEVASTNDQNEEEKIGESKEIPAPADVVTEVEAQPNEEEIPPVTAEENIVEADPVTEDNIAETEPPAAAFDAQPEFASNEQLPDEDSAPTESTLKTAETAQEDPEVATTDVPGKNDEKAKEAVETGEENSQNDTPSQEKVSTSEEADDPSQDVEGPTEEDSKPIENEKQEDDVEMQQPSEVTPSEEPAHEEGAEKSEEPTDVKPGDEEKKVEEANADVVEGEEAKVRDSVQGEDTETLMENDAKLEPFKKAGIEMNYDESGNIVQREATVSPPLTKTPTSKSSSAKGSKKGLSDDFYYDAEEFQSMSCVSDESGIPLNMLQFFHSFGYDCRKRSNLHLLRGPTALFAAGNLVHLLHLGTAQHTFLRSCSGGGIGALTVHPSGKYFVVAEKGTKPHILIYEYPSLRLYRILRGGTERAYSFVDFSPKGDLLASVGSAPDYMLTLWDWKQEKVMLRSKAFSQEVYRVTFSPEQEGQLTSCGTTHIRFWKMAWTFTGLKLKGELGRFGKTELSDIEGYIQLPDGKVLSGSDWGNMLLWDGGLIKVELSRKNQKPIHVGSIQQLVMDEGELITIGLDGYVRVWEMEAIDSADTTDDSDIFEIEPMNELKVGHDVQLTCMVKASPEDDPELEDGASIWYAQDANGGIWKLDLSFSHTTKAPEKLFSFTAGAITGIACSPLSHLVATTGDAYVRVYDYLDKNLLCQYFSPTPHTTGTSLIWPTRLIDPKGTLMIAGFSDGIMRVLKLQQVENTNMLTLKQALKPHSSSITAMAFDNSGEFLATGSTDRTVFFFAVGSEEFEPLGFVQTPGEVTSLEWSPGGFPDTTLLVSCSNGKVVEISAPTSSSVDTSHSFMLHDLSVKYYTFQSIKSRLRRDELREKREKEKAERRKKREKELKRRKDKGEEISDEDGKAFLDEDPEAEEEKEEEPLYFPPEPNSILQAFYLTPGRFCLSMDGFDAGYLYECEFPSGSATSDSETPLEPVRAVAVRDSDDIPISAFKFSEDRHKLVGGFKNGLIRVYPIEGDSEAPFDLDMLNHHWNLNMHDNDTGIVRNITESHDGAYFFTGGCDGNLYGYVSLAHETIAKSMEGKRAKLPTPKKASSIDKFVDDIDDPHAYSIEDAKLKAEHDKMIREAEAKKMRERKNINKLRKSFLDLIHKNSELPEAVQLPRQEFELDPSLRRKMVAHTQDRMERVRLEMQWEKAKLELAHQKLENRFRSQIDCDRIVVHSFNSSHVIASYRISKLSEEYHNLVSSIEERVRINSLTSEGGTAATHMDGTGASLASDRANEEPETIDDATSYLNEAKQKKKSTILHGRQAEKVAKALQKAAEAKKKREKRQDEWDELYKSKPDEFYEDPADVAAIREAQANMGDFKLKTAPDYVVPEHLRMDTEKKRYQILLLQGLIHRAKSDFNAKLMGLRDDKFEKIEEMKEFARELKKLQNKMMEAERLPIPPIPRPHWEEEPQRKYEYTKDTLLKFEEEAKQREIDEAMKKRKGDGGLFGGFGDEKEEDDSLKGLGHGHKRTSSIASSGYSMYRKQTGQVELDLPTTLEIQLSQIENIRIRYQRDRLLRLIEEKMTSFDSELRLLRNTKQKLDVDLKMADLRQVTLIEELLLLKEYEKREKTLSGRVMSKKNELAEINGKAAEMQVKLEAKRRDIERLSDREKALHASFAASLGDNNKFADFLNKVFKKKIKRAKKKIAVEGQDEDSDDSSSDESDFSSDEDEDDSVEGGFDDSVCPAGCDSQLFDSAIALREKRLDLEEALVEEKKLADTLKKDADSYAKKAKVMESQLRNALADLEAFQVEKQGKLNELDVVVPLRLHQVEHVYNATVPNDLSPCLVFANSSLTALQRRIKELQHEKSEQRKYYKEARQQHVHLIKNRRIMEERINLLEERCEHMMMLKFGRVVDLEKLDAVTVNKNVEELKEQVRRNEEKNSNELLRRQKHIDRLKERITELMRENTKRLESLNVLVADKDELEQGLDHRQRTLELEDNSKKKQELREQHRLVQLVQLQAQEIQALKEEIGLLSRKGGHILPPAQPPLGQEGDGL